MINAACYLRVSTEEQSEYSPDAQLRAIREFCRRNNFALLDNHIYIDEGISGRSAAKRPEFQKMIAAAKTKSKPFDAIIVHKFDRFARSREDSVVYKSLLRKECGIRVVSVTENIEDDKFSVILEAMLEAMAEYYSINLAEEVKKGMTEKALRGEPLTIAPYGYKMEKKKLEIYPEQAETVSKIFDDFIKGGGYLEIAKQLNAAGIRTNRGNKFENRTIEYILCNPVYIGKIRWNPAGRTRRDYDNDNVLTIQGNHKPLVSEDVFLKARDRVLHIKKRYAKYSKAEAASHWLVGIIKCSNCGKGLVKNGEHYFQCRGYVGGTCNHSHSIAVKDAENSILSQLETDCTGLKSYTVQTNIKAATDSSYTQKLIITLKKRLWRAKEAYAAGVDTLEEYKANKKQITDEVAKLKAKLEEAFVKSIKNIDSIGFMGSIASLKSKISMSEKKKIAANIFNHILYNKSNRLLLIIYNS